MEIASRAKQPKPTTQRAFMPMKNNTADNPDANDNANANNNKYYYNNNNNKHYYNNNNNNNNNNSNSN